MPKAGPAGKSAGNGGGGGEAGFRSTVSVGRGLARPRQLGVFLRDRIHRVPRVPPQDVEAGGHPLRPDSSLTSHTKRVEAVPIRPVKLKQPILSLRRQAFHVDVMATGIVKLAKCHRFEAMELRDNLAEDLLDRSCVPAEGSIEVDVTRPPCGL